MPPRPLSPCAAIYVGTFFLTVDLQIHFKKTFFSTADVLQKNCWLQKKLFFYNWSVDALQKKTLFFDFAKKRCIAYFWSEDALQKKPVVAVVIL